MISSTSIDQAIKPGSVLSVEQDVPVENAAQLMSCHNVGSLLVEEKGQIIAIITERDILNKIVSAQLDPKTTPVNKIMSDKLVTVNLNDTVQTAYEIMNQINCRHLPVVNDGKIIGIISIRDVLTCFVHDLQQVVFSQQSEIKRTDQMLTSIMNAKNKPVDKSTQ